MFIFLEIVAIPNSPIDQRKLCSIFLRFSWSLKIADLCFDLAAIVYRTLEQPDLNLGSVSEFSRYCVLISAPRDFNFNIYVE